jgi:hypothetical protein
MSQNDDNSSGIPDGTSGNDGTRRWAPIADRLNPNRAAYDPKFKATWNTMSKAQRKRVVQQDRKTIRALKERGKTQLPFTADPDDHCETSSIAYSHIAPLLEYLASQKSSTTKALQIYDPYFCAGGTVQHLQSLGFEKVYNQPEDFYQMIATGKVPPHDVIVTNPPYSGDHLDRLLTFLKDNGKPFFLLLPDHFAQRPSYVSASTTWLQNSLVFLTPPQRYHYWTPKGRRRDNDNATTAATTTTTKVPKDPVKGNNNETTTTTTAKKRTHSNLFLGTRNSPFPSFWFISLEPVLKRKTLIKAFTRTRSGDDDVDEGHNDDEKTKRLQLPAGCLLHKDLNAAKAAEQSFRGGAGEEADHQDPSKVSTNNKKRPKKKKKRKIVKEAGYQNDSAPQDS